MSKICMWACCPCLKWLSVRSRKYCRDQFYAAFVANLNSQHQPSTNIIIPTQRCADRCMPPSPPSCHCQNNLTTYPRFSSEKDAYNVHRKTTTAHNATSKISHVTIGSTYYRVLWSSRKREDTIRIRCNAVKEVVCTPRRGGVRGDVGLNPASLYIQGITYIHITENRDLTLHKAKIRDTKNLVQGNSQNSRKMRWNLNRLLARRNAMTTVFQNEYSRWDILLQKLVCIAFWRLSSTISTCCSCIACTIQRILKIFWAGLSQYSLKQFVFDILKCIEN